MSESSLTIGQEILVRADRLARWSDTPGGLTCAYLTPAHRATAKQLRQWMSEAGLRVSVDAIGNVIGRLSGAKPGRKTLIVGSHYDTLRNAGRYAGRLGILLAIAVAARLKAEAHVLPFDLEVIAFAEEEGLRFSTSYLASSAVAGRFDESALTRQDAAGIVLADALRDAGLPANEIPDAARRPEDLLGYLEVYIEQGPVLLDANLPLGVVTAIAGSVQRRLTVTGEAGDAGTIPMGFRRDAATAAAEIVLAVEKLCLVLPGVVGTVGQLAVPHGALHVIPGRCDLSLDVRSGDDRLRDEALDEIDREVAAIAARRKVTVETQELHRFRAVACAPAMLRRIADAVVKAGVPVHSLPSGAGHDAVMFGGLTEVGMLFLRCGNGGISHDPRETVAAADVSLAAQALRDVFLSYPA
ncbi:MAG TPA: allantoate amidohydrolase [Alphaproteobacteria bacterium]|jgi:hydantoinase/carbamoylase family amidase